MKLITAIIQPNKLNEVREALLQAEIYRITVSRCSGRGQAMGNQPLPRTKSDAAPYS